MLVFSSSFYYKLSISSFWHGQGENLQRFNCNWNRSACRYCCFQLRFQKPPRTCDRKIKSKIIVNFIYVKQKKTEPFSTHSKFHTPSSHRSALLPNTVTRNKSGLIQLDIPRKSIALVSFMYCETVFFFIYFSICLSVFIFCVCVCVFFCVLSFFISFAHLISFKVLDKSKLNVKHLFLAFVCSCVCLLLLLLLLFLLYHFILIIS